MLRACNELQHLIKSTTVYGFLYELKQLFSFDISIPIFYINYYQFLINQTIFQLKIFPYLPSFVVCYNNLKLVALWLPGFESLSMFFKAIVFNGISGATTISLFSFNITVKALVIKRVRIWQHILLKYS